MFKNVMIGIDSADRKGDAIALARAAGPVERPGDHELTTTAG
jgi:hypothetical protein